MITNWIRSQRLKKTPSRIWTEEDRSALIVLLDFAIEGVLEGDAKRAHSALSMSRDLLSAQVEKHEKIRRAFDRLCEALTKCGATSFNLARFRLDDIEVDDALKIINMTDEEMQTYAKSIFDYYYSR